MLRISQALQPIDLVGWFYVEDYVHATLALRMWRNAKHVITNDGRLEVLRPTLEASYALEALPKKEVEENMLQHMSGMTESPGSHRADVVALLEWSGVTLDDVAARGMVRRSDR